MTSCKLWKSRGIFFSISAIGIRTLRPALIRRTPRSRSSCVNVCLLTLPSLASAWRLQSTGSFTSPFITAPPAERRASYDWQSSIDGGKTWVDLPQTLQSKTTVTGQASMTTVQFRYRATVKLGEGAWSQPISILVM